MSINKASRSDKSRAKRVFDIYKRQKLLYPKANEKDIFKETANAYLRAMRCDDNIRSRVDSSIEGISDIKDLASSLMIFDGIDRDNIGDNNEERKKLYLKKQKTIDDAYNETIGDTT